MNKTGIVISVFAIILLLIGVIYYLTKSENSIQPYISPDNNIIQGDISSDTNQFINRSTHIH